MTKMFKMNIRTFWSGLQSYFIICIVTAFDLKYEKLDDMEGIRIYLK